MYTSLSPIFTLAPARPGVALPAHARLGTAMIGLLGSPSSGPAGCAEPPLPVVPPAVAPPAPWGNPPVDVTGPPPAPVIPPPPRAPLAPTRPPLDDAAPPFVGAPPLPVSPPVAPGNPGTPPV